MNYTVQYARKRGCNVGLDINTTKNIVFCQRQTNRQQKGWNCEENPKSIMNGYGWSNCNSILECFPKMPFPAKFQVVGLCYFKDIILDCAVTHIAVVSQRIFRYQVSTVGIGR